MTKKEQYKNEFKKYLDDIKELGYKVYVNNKIDWNYGYITNETDLCYCQLGDYGEGLSLGTENKKGINFDMCPDCKVIYEVTREIIEYAFGSYPIWSELKDREGIIKYIDWNDFINHYWDKQNIIEY